MAQKISSKPKHWRGRLKCTDCAGPVTEMSRTGVCRACWRERVGKAKAALADEKLRERAARAEERRARAAARAEQRREKQRALQKAWRLKNADRARDLTKRWRAENPERHRANKKRGKRQEDSKRRQRVICDLLPKQGGRCAYCRASLSVIHVDHIQPRARQGSNARRNLQLTCAPCNMAKGAKDPIEFARETGRLL
jgi:5-methylcytosine-specific restriction endonuclease McrA